MAHPRITKAVELSGPRRAGRARAGIGCLVGWPGKAPREERWKRNARQRADGNDVIRAALLCGLREIRPGGKPLLLAGVDCNHPVRNGSSGGAASQAKPKHTHVWKKHTAQKWVPNIITVVDKPEQTVKYSVYKMYWYTTGTWEETETRRVSRMG